ncbi:MAG: hypothetical protein SGI83_05040 [Bacteroidota bacterium]|nr:hypothetical protein [Bacteroidota bacterium]
MKFIYFFSLLIFSAFFSFSQQVTLFEHANYTGQSKSLGVGQHRVTYFNDIASSIKVPPGMGAIIYEHATDAMGYGIWVDLLEDRPDLSVYNLNDKVSYVSVFYVSNNNMVWARNAIVNGQFIPGHWERKRAKPAPTNTIAVAGPAIAGPALTDPSVLAVNGPTTTITTLGVQSAEGRNLWETAMNEQMGIIGNDYRGIEEIGSAAFQRASNNTVIPDNLNFWYPQRLKNDHRAVVFYKRTLAGKVQQARQVNIAGTFQDYDVNIDIVPNPKYMYMITEGHRREYTALMSSQWTLSAHQSGQASCDDEHSISFFNRVEAEIAEDYWPQGDHTFGRARLSDLTLIRTGKDMCVYGPWIYDKGHCCQPEIHPAEQLWWSEQQTGGKKYNLNVVCDGSRRFLWRKQMDDGTKLKPWGAPPIKGLFAIAFEYNLPLTDVMIGHSTKQFEVANIQHHNVIEYPNADQTYNLVYQNKTLVSFIPHNNAFKVSFEQVGIVPGEPRKIRGFLVIETFVGVATQIATSITLFNGSATQIIKLPANSTPEQAPQAFEDRFFKKEAGHYYFTIMETSKSKEQPVFERRQ